MTWLTTFFIKTTYATEGGKNPGVITIENPLGEDATLATLFSRVLDFMVTIAISVLTIMILIAAFHMMTSGGNPQKFDLGKKTLLYAIIGFAILLIAEGLVKLVEAILSGTL